MAASGTIGGFAIIDKALVNSDGTAKFVLQNATTYALSSQALSFGWINPGGPVGGSTYASIKNTRVPNVPLGTENIALMLDASGAINNYALDMPTGGIRTNGSRGLTQTISIPGVGVTRNLQFKNGLLVGYTET